VQAAAASRRTAGRAGRTAGRAGRAAGRAGRAAGRAGRAGRAAGRERTGAAMAPEPFLPATGRCRSPPMARASPPGRLHAGDDASQHRYYDPAQYYYANP
jgi:hypothetical protein